MINVQQENYVTRDFGKKLFPKINLCKLIRFFLLIPNKCHKSLLSLIALILQPKNNEKKESHYR